ncbi:IS110 family transposase [Enterococcus sp. BWB1-3]|uniref:IS110 family transposase n=1 Tax=Enterococcus sp. BWB1-3 TaxID=2787713 RepID=UPI001921CFA9|nr:IS110 family transposase [Enterococcus sp. BWB1-3]MBL1230977.1 IS110 family transposase [Enterococcus sp. BWB1-3]
MEDVLRSCCAGLDIHQKVIVACVIRSAEGKKRPEKFFGSFETTTRGLLDLSDWLSSYEVTHISMESTGVYWKCVWRILQNHFDLQLANPRHIKNIPGKKTDMKDAEWIARLTRLGVVPTSFVPPEPIQELRDITRYRKHLVEDLNREKNRGHMVLQSAGIKLTSVIKDVYGKSGRALLYALIENKEITETLILECVYTTLRRKVPQLMDSLEGFMTVHYRKMLALHLKQIECLEKQIQEVEETINDYLTPYEEYVERLEELPGINRRTAAVVLAEIGIDLSVFPTAGHLASWAGVSPGNNQSAGKTYSRRVGKGNSYLKKVLAQGALAVSQGKPNRIQAFFFRIRRNTGHKKAVVATVHLMVRIIYRMFSDASRYQELGENYLQNRKNTLTNNC